MNRTEKVLYSRINRKLRAQGKVLKRARSERLEFEIGKFFLVDRQSNFIERHDVDLSQFARELGLRGMA